tara:strand:- start:4067 stop:4933 length:867 start_codon:yes stop_codon:yes gene_type:complete
MATVLVTGSAGSMGRLVCSQLAANKHSVRAFDLPSANFMDMPDNVTAVCGDLTSVEDNRKAVKGVDAVIHLAAILPPTADEKIDLARKVNVEGTRVLVEAVDLIAPNARFVFSSSVSVYGVPAIDQEVRVSDPYNPDDNYAKTKADSEQIVIRSDLDYCVLRISGVAIPVFQEPPTGWPFRPNQKIEFIHRDDAVNAIVAGVTSQSIENNRVINVSGGPTWRMTGAQYVADYFNMIEVDPAEAIYQDVQGHFAWYMDEGGQEAFDYQRNPYPLYLDQLQLDITRLMEG